MYVATTVVLVPGCKVKLVLLRLTPEIGPHADFAKV